MKVLAIFLVCVAAVLAGPSDPEPRPDQWWVDRHNAFVQNTLESGGNIPIIFYGDSITEGWGGSPVFYEKYEPLGVANYGIGGDQTQHVLWRLQNGEIQGLNPKLIVLKIGTNNLWGSSNADIAAGIGTIVQYIRQQLPNTNILLLGVLPRNGADAFTYITEINRIASGFHDGSRVFFFDMFDTFTESWGVVPAQYFYDGLHLTNAGYEKWAAVMDPIFNQLRA